MTDSQSFFMPTVMITVFILLLTIYFLQQKEIISKNASGKYMFMTFSLVPLLIGGLLLFNYFSNNSEINLADRSNNLTAGLIMFGIGLVVLIAAVGSYIANVKEKVVENSEKWKHF